MAMHIHGPFSEQAGSMEGHLQQATVTGVDVLWWTDHDGRLEQYKYRSVVHFDSLTTEAGDGLPWTWQPRAKGSLVSSSGGIQTRNVSPHDLPGSGALSLAARASTGTASFGYYAESHPAGWNYHCNLYGQTLTIDVFMPSDDSEDGYLELLIDSSWHPANNGRPAGYYSLSYRFDTSDAKASTSAQGAVGVVTIPVTPGTWNTVSMTPSTDVAMLWPDMETDDFASFGITLNAVSNGSEVSGVFDFLRFTREHIAGDLPLQRQQAMMSAYAAPYPDVTQLQGLEFSLLSTHVNWFGPGVTLPDLTSVTSRNYNAFLGAQVDKIHTAGGVASYNHPFGANLVPERSASAQDALVISTASALLSNNVLGCDIMEVGYLLRNGVNLAHHAALWDLLSANSRFVTANGVSDDHDGTDWAGRGNNWTTSVWAPSRRMSDLVAALRAGRAWTSSLSRFSGSLDLSADGVAPMGSVTLSSALTRQVRVLATGVPPGGSVDVLRGAVDYLGVRSAKAVVVATIPAASLLGGTALRKINTRTECYVRTRVKDARGSVIALSNPVWLLRNTPPSGIPIARVA